MLSLHCPLDKSETNAATPIHNSQATTVHPLQYKGGQWRGADVPPTATQRSNQNAASLRRTRLDTGCDAKGCNNPRELPICLIAEITPRLYVLAARPVTDHVHAHSNLMCTSCAHSQMGGCLILSR